MRVISLALLVLLSADVFATEIISVQPERRDGWLRLAVHARDLLDDRTRSTVESGLPGTCVYRIVLVNDQGAISAQRLLSFALRFDVWEELYRLDGPGGEQVFSSLADADSAWANLENIAIARLNTLRETSQYRLQVFVAVRPIAPEDRLRVAEFVNQSSAGQSEEMHIDIGALVSRLVGGRRPDAGESFETGPFRPAELTEDPDL